MAPAVLRRAAARTSTAGEKHPVVVVGLLAALAAVPIASLARPTTGPSVATPAVLQSPTRPMTVTIPRLHSLQPSRVGARTPSRNLFSFAPRPQTIGAPAARSSVAAVAAPALPPRPSNSLQLIGMAEDADGARTAIIVGPEGVMLVDAGHQVTERFRVTTIEGDSVALLDIATGAVVTFTHIGQKIEISD